MLELFPSECRDFSRSSWRPSSFRFPGSQYFNQSRLSLDSSWSKVGLTCKLSGYSSRARFAEASPTILQFGSSTQDSIPCCCPSSLGFDIEATKVLEFLHFTRVSCVMVFRSHLMFERGGLCEGGSNLTEVESYSWFKWWYEPKFSIASKSWFNIRIQGNYGSNQKNLRYSNRNTHWFKILFTSYAWCNDLLIVSNVELSGSTGLSVRPSDS